MVHDNSREQYKKLIRSGSLQPQERIVLQYIFDNPGLNRHEISRGLNLQYTSVCGRVSSLKDRGLIFEKGIKNKKTKLYFMDSDQNTAKIHSLIDKIRKVICKIW